MKFGRKSICIVGSMVAAVLIAACSSSGGETAKPTDGSSANGTSATPIKVGLICTCSGPFGATNGLAGKVGQAWAKAANASGGIAGHPVELIFKDDAGNPGTAATAIQSMISANVAVILDQSIVQGAWAKLADDARIPVVGGNITSPLYYQDPNFYPSGGTGDGAAVADILVAKQAGATNLGQLYCAEAPQCQESVETHVQAGKKYGVPVIYSASIAATAPSFTAQCVAAKQAGVTALFIGHTAAVFARVAKDCARQNYNPIYVEQGIGLTPELSSTSAVNNRLWAQFPLLPLFSDTAAVKKMEAAVDKYFPGMRKSSNWSQGASEDWVGGLLIEKALSLAGVQSQDEVTSAVIRKGLESITNETLDGWAPPLTFTAGETHSVKCWFVGRLQDNKLVALNDGKPTCADK